MLQVHYQGGGYQQYSSQDSLPDSPYSSQSLDSHAGQTTGESFCNVFFYTFKTFFLDTRRSMPNLNKMRGGRVGGHNHHQQPTSANPSYGLSQVGLVSSKNSPIFFSKKKRILQKF